MSATWPPIIPPTVPPAKESSSTSATFAAASEALDPHQRLHRESEQSIAREDCHGFAEDFVAGWFAAAEIVVIERGQIVVDQRIGVDHFERATRFDRAVRSASEMAAAACRQRIGRMRLPPANRL